MRGQIGTICVTVNQLQGSERVYGGESTEEFGIILSPVYFLFGLISNSTEEFGIKRRGIYPIVSGILPIVPRIFPITLVYLI